LREEDLRGGSAEWSPPDVTGRGGGGPLWKKVPRGKKARGKDTSKEVRGNLEGRRAGSRCLRLKRKLGQPKRFGS